VCGGSTIPPFLEPAPLQMAPQPVWLGAIFLIGKLKWSRQMAQPAPSFEVYFRPVWPKPRGLLKKMATLRPYPRRGGREGSSQQAGSQPASCEPVLSPPPSSRIILMGQLARWKFVLRFSLDFFELLAV